MFSTMLSAAWRNGQRWRAVSPSKQKPLGPSRPLSALSHRPSGGEGTAWHHWTDERLDEVSDKVSDKGRLKRRQQVPQNVQTPAAGRGLPALPTIAFAL